MKLLKYVAGVGLENQPYRLSGFETQRLEGTKGQVDGKHCATIDLRDDSDILLTQRQDSTRNDVSCAQVMWLRARKQDVPRANANTHWLSSCNTCKRNLQRHF